MHSRRHCLAATGPPSAGNGPVKSRIEYCGCYDPVCWQSRQGVRRVVAQRKTHQRGGARSFVGVVHDRL